MNISSQRVSFSVGLASVPAVLATTGAVLGLALMPLPARGQASDFNSGNDAGWTRYTLPAYGAAAFSFPADGSGGKAYRIAAPPTGADPGGMRNARAGSFRADAVYQGRFSVGADLLEWNASWRQEAGLLYYFQDVGPGSSDGYVATYSSGYKQLYISAVYDEAPTTVAELGSGTIVLDPIHRYRLVASSHDGYTHLFQLFDKSQPESPWASAITQDATYGAGLCGVFVFEQDYPSDTQGAAATFDNYVATAPASGAMPATVTDLSPPPAGKSTAIHPTVIAAILDRDTAVDPESIALWVDGVSVPAASLAIDPVVKKANNPTGWPREFAGATVTCTLADVPSWGSVHTCQVAFRDSAGTRRTNIWSWTAAYPRLAASNSLPVGSLSVRGFEARTVQSDNGGATLENSLARANRQLAVPPQIALDRSATSVVQVLDWNKASVPPDNVPGLCAGSYANIAVECMAYLELSAGVHRFHIATDDRAGVYSGATPGDAAALALWEAPDNTANTTFDFWVEAAGLYPVRCLWEETGGSALMRLWSVDLGDLSEVLVNDTATPAGVVKAWYPLLCRSAATVTGPYTVEAAARNVLTEVDLTDSECESGPVGSMVTGGTFILPLPAATRFYRLEGTRATRITRIQKAGTSLEIGYLLH
jgi:hypothetical protein